MFRAQLPRLYALKDLTPDPDSLCAYFKDFEIKLQTLRSAIPWYTSVEKKLQYLNMDAWEALKIEASQYLNCRDPDRGWAQLIDILCQADGYRHLKDLGCSEVNFIPKSSKKGRKTPDLEGLLGSRRVLCEVKCITVSNDERLARRDYTKARKYDGQLSAGLLQKLQSCITRAKDQIHAYDPQGEARQVVYISIEFDEGGGFNRDDELRQVKQYLNDNPPGIEVAYGAWN